MADNSLLNSIIAGHADSSILLFKNDYQASLDIGASWSVIHFTLTNAIPKGEEDHPLKYVVLGGTPVHESDEGIVPTYLTAVR